MKSWVLLLGTMFLWGLIPILDKRGLAAAQADPEAGLMVRLFAAAAIILLVLPFSRHLQNDLRTLSWSAIGFFAASGVVSMILAQYCYYQLLDQQGVSRVFPVLFAGAPLVGMTLAWLFLGEAVSLKMITGGVLIAAGSVLLLL